MAQMPQLIEYLQTRRSALALTLEEPGPTAGELTDILTIASRVPDHGKLARWRFIVYSKDSRDAVRPALQELLEQSVEGDLRERGQKELDRFMLGPLAIGVVSQAGEHPKIPEWEQVLSAGAVCTKLLMAANAHGFEAQWLTGWHTYDEGAVAKLGLNAGERFAGIIHVGSTSIAKTERPRPDMDTLISHF
ncbi:MAG: nitroreductase [Pseudomonadota bacterium]